MSSQTNESGSSIRWTRAFSVNIESLDKQHQDLFGKMAGLSRALSLGEGGAVVDSVLADLVAYANQHFADEEALMANHEFPTLSHHRAQHDKFREQVKAFIEDHKQGRVGVPAQLLLFMQRWLKEHVTHTDMQYSSFLNARGVR
jgi:hemerythrin-like metal-binding protein